MKDLLSTEHYCYKVYTLFMKTIGYDLSIDNPTIRTSSHFYKLILISHSMIFQKSQPPIIKGDSHYVTVTISHIYIKKIKTKIND